LAWAPSLRIPREKVVFRAFALGNILKQAGIPGEKYLGIHLEFYRSWEEPL